MMEEKKKIHITKKNNGYSKCVKDSFVGKMYKSDLFGQQKREAIKSL